MAALETPAAINNVLYRTGPYHAKLHLILDILRTQRLLPTARYSFIVTVLHSSFLTKGINTLI